MKKQFNFASVKVLIIFIFSVGFASLATAKCVYLKPMNIKKMGMGYMLSWETTEEADIQSFVIQRSTNGIDFKNAGDVKGAGYSTKVTSYRFLDLIQTGTKTCYRLLHYATDGSFTISETFFMEENNNSNFTVASVNSTITNSELNLTIAAKRSMTVDFEVINRSGRIVKKGSQKMNAGSNSININCKAFSKGAYNVVLRNGSKNSNITIKKVSEREMPQLEYSVVNR
ncbi:MAG: hypothetical protein AB8H03_07380 [Saprospiraceae bacterium]